MDQPAGLDSGPNPIDRHVGLRIRLRRKELGLSQEKLAESIGLTFQQIQKYERAANRVSASKLWALARVLQISVSYFYEGLGQAEDAMTALAPDPSVHDFLLTSEGIELASLFGRIRHPKLRRKILELIRAMTDDIDPAET
jgi:transcriptional regulator with XRE-family HTH domain